MNIKFPDEVIDQLADAVEARIAARNIKAHKKPLTVPEFAKATAMSKDTVYRLLKAGSVRRVPGLAKKLIPAAELEKYQ